MQHFVSSYGNVQLKESLFSQHRDRDVRYLMEPRTEDLLFSHYAEAGLNDWLNYTPKTHGGWDSPTSQIPWHFYRPLAQCGCPYLPGNWGYTAKSQG